MAALLRWVMLFVLMAAGTWLVGWWAIPVLGLGWGLTSGVRVASWPAGAAAATAWGTILGTAPWDGLRRLAAALGGIFGLPGWAVPVLTLVVGGLLGWSGARVGAGVARVAMDRRRAGEPAAGTGPRAQGSLN